MKLRDVVDILESMGEGLWSAVEVTLGDDRKKNVERFNLLGGFFTVSIWVTLVSFAIVSAKIVTFPFKVLKKLLG